jgi:hypothetical protein
MVVSLGIRLHFPELDLSSLLPFPNLPALIGSLLIGHPAGIFITLLKTRHHQVNGVTTAVCLVGGRVHGHSNRSPAWLPRLLPWSYTVFQHVDDPVGHFLAEVPLFRLRSRRV